MNGCALISGGTSPPSRSFARTRCEYHPDGSTKFVQNELQIGTTDGTTHENGLLPTGGRVETVIDAAGVKTSTYSYFDYTDPNAAFSETWSHDAFGRVEEYDYALEPDGQRDHVIERHYTTPHGLWRDEG